MRRQTTQRTSIPVSTRHGDRALSPSEFRRFASPRHFAKVWSNGRRALRGHRVGVAPEKGESARGRRPARNLAGRGVPFPATAELLPAAAATGGRRAVECVGEKGFAFALAHPVSPRRRPRGDGGSSAKRSRDRPTTTVVKAKTTPIFSPLGDARPP